MSVLTFAAAFPVFDEGATAITLAAAAGSVVWAVAAGAAPPRWYAVPGSLAGSLLVLVPVPALLAATAVANLFDLADPFTADWLVRLDPEAHVASPLLLPLAVAVVGLAAALTVPRPPLNRYAMLGIVLLTALLTAAQYPLPLVAFVAVLGPFGLVLAFPGALLTLLVLGEITLLAAYVMLRRTGQAASLAGLVLPAALAGFLWAGGHLLDVPYDRCSLVTLLVLGLLALSVPRFEVELVAPLAVLLGAALGIPGAADPSVSLAVHLTLAGALVTVSSCCTVATGRSRGWVGCCSPRPPGCGSTTWASMRPRRTRCPPPSCWSWSACTGCSGTSTPTRRPRCCPGWRWPPCRRCSGPWSTRCRPGPRCWVPAAWCCCWAAPRSAGPLRSSWAGWSAARWCCASSRRTPSRRRSGSSLARRRPAAGLRHQLGGAAPGSAPGGGVPGPAPLTGESLRAATVRGGRSAASRAAAGAGRRPGAGAVRRDVGT